MIRVKLLSIKCILNDETDKDEIFLKLDGEKIWPKGAYQSIDHDEKHTIEITINHEDEMLHLELWDYDFLSANDLLGTFDMNVSEQGGPYQTDLKLQDATSMASYTLHWEATSST